MLSVFGCLWFVTFNVPFLLSSVFHLGNYIAFCSGCLGRLVNVFFLVILCLVFDIRLHSRQFFRNLDTSLLWLGSLVLCSSWVRYLLQSNFLILFNLFFMVFDRFFSFHIFHFCFFFETLDSFFSYMYS